MGKKEKDKSKKHNEIRAIVREELENVLQNLSGNIQFSFNPPIEEPTTETVDTTEGTEDQNPTEEQVDTKSDSTDQEES
ncbi:hypothetical protein [Fredinandcohnia onubensis]|uniref:hypothetical protein n=1 Tax=Fredinandcohnia onubensis TaxID=1571209 RepID=UPI000C0BEC2B|nr:hypothetical protein [Fredinandcohnia onubensis]